MCLLEPATILRSRLSSVCVSNGAKRNSAGQREPTVASTRFRAVQKRLFSKSLCRSTPTNFVGDHDADKDNRWRVKNSNSSLTIWSKPLPL